MSGTRKTDVLSKFSTPIWIGEVDNAESINKNILEYINVIKKENPQGLSKSNQLGWHSPDLDLKNEVIKNFFYNISPMIKEVSDDMRWDLSGFEIKVSSCWSIINKKFASNAGHIHANSLISSAYYVQIGKDCGNIVFDDPRPGAVVKKHKYTKVGDWNQGNVSIEPKEGLLVMFPSYLTHYVQPNMSDKERIILSFNLDIIKKNDQ
ncbi:MAG: hypothetical protein CFH21_00153 [Alphaproteobacteria bacterium MarineAlpha5_Bin11]|nr:hypothetical protein [Pelagibacteraceae bacterium]PPR44905.1 MAG: hypothetical protein CFH21_00153 [Alphaproteobacteria bacterium MarineAlpha5_Bin11]PPR51839.1 MAG: hypothetical protein CFH20_00257 [Alphaproteobacteria bacterium MarineAlpha5_Bin10]|tara:strand:- start:501 stop:1121 length:621 start_codon:yes stop_codon:yes gene_type:complete